jgi:hypothetical protein
MRRTILLLASIALGVLLACGVALAAEITCAPRVGNCVGTNNDDTMTGTADWDDIYARRGDDIVKGLGALDLIR